MNRALRKAGFRLIAVGAVAATPIIIKNARPIARAVGDALQNLGKKISQAATEEAVRPGPQEAPMPDPKRSDEVPPAPDIPEAPASPQHPDPHEPQEPTPNPEPEPERRATKVRQSKPQAKSSKARTAKAAPKRNKSAADAAASPGI